jgi:ligand-binding sensor domain-containing protein
MRPLHKSFWCNSLAFLIAFFTGSANAQTNFWEPTKGPYGGIIQSFAINSNGDIFAGTSGGGVYRSIDNGDSWTIANSGLASFSVQALVINALAINSNRDIFAGTRGDGVFRSTDNGDSWTATDLMNSDVRSLAVNLSGDIFAGTGGDGVFRSTNNGDSWTAVNTDLTNLNVQALVINSNGSIFAGTSAGIFRSTNNGNNWAAVDSGLTNTDIQALAINLNEDIFAGTRGDGVFRSTDNGDRWTATGLTRTNLIVQALAIDSATQHIFAGTFIDGVFRSIDNGDNWTALNNGLTGSINILATKTNGHIFAGTSGYGVFRSTNDGDKWTAVNAGLTNTFVNAFAVDPSTRDIFASITTGSGTTDGIYRSTDNGETWIISLSLQHAFAAGFFSLAINSGGDIFAGDGYNIIEFFRFPDYGDIFRSTDNGVSWQKVALRLDDYVYALAINSSGRIFAGTGEGLYRATPSLEFWHEVHSGRVFSVAINDSDYIFIGTTNGIYRSKDTGDSWELVIDLPNNSTLALAINASTQYIFAGTQKRGVLRSTNNGDSWTEVNTGLTNTNVPSLAINSRGDIFAGTNGGGVFRSTDNGASWSDVNSGLMNPYVLALAINSSGEVFAGTSGNGIFRSLPTITAVEEIAVEIPTSFVLTQNYPNPFNPSTTIEYSLPKPSQVELKVYDILGKEVRTLVNGRQPAGQHRVSFEANGLPSGVYFYRIKGGAFVQTKKLTLLR